MPPSPKTADAVTRVFFREGVNIAPGKMVTSQDAENDKVQMEMHPAGVRIVGEVQAGPFHIIVPWAMIKSVNLG